MILRYTFVYLVVEGSICFGFGIVRLLLGAVFLLVGFGGACVCLLLAELVVKFLFYVCDQIFDFV